MGRSLESYRRKSLDAVDEADFEKDGLIDYSQIQNDEEELDDTFSALFTEEELAELRAEEAREEEEKRFQKMIAESEEPEPPYDYDAQTLGKATRGVPTQDTLDAAKQDKNMETQYKGFIEIAEDADLPNPELEKRLAEAVAELEGMF